MSAAYPRLMEALNEVRGQWRRTKLIEGCLLALAGTAAVLVTLIAIDNLFKPDTLGRTLLAVLLYGGLFLFLMGLVVRRILEDQRDDFFAAIVEQQHPELHNQLINALQLGRDNHAGFSKELIAAIVRDADRSTADMDMGDSIDRRPTRRALMMACGALAVMLLYAASAWAFFANGAIRVLVPILDVAPHTRTRIVPLNEKKPDPPIEPGQTKVPEGDPVAFAVKTAGVIPETAQLHRKTAKGSWQVVTMQPDAPGSEFFRFVVQQAAESFQYYITAGDARSNDYRVEVVKPPQVERLSLTYQKPQYTGQGPSNVAESDGEISGIAGTKVTVQLKSSKPLQSAEFVLKSQEEIKLDKVDDKTWTTSFLLWTPKAKAEPGMEGRQIIAPTTYQIRLLDTDGYGNKDPLWRNINLAKDQVPMVSILAPSDRLTLKAEDSVAITVESRDDFGLSEVRLVCQKNDKEEIIELARWPHDKAPELSAMDKYRWVLAKTGVSALKPNDHVKYWAEVKDRNVVTGPGRAESRQFYIDVVSPEAAVAKLDTQIFDYAQMLEILLKLQRDNRVQTAGTPAVEGQDKLVAEFKKGIDARAALMERVQKVKAPNEDEKKQRIAMLGAEIAARSDLHKAAVAARAKKDANGYKAAILVARETVIRDKTSDLARAMEKDGLPLFTMVQGLDKLVFGFMADALNLLEKARTTEQETMAVSFRNQSLPIQDKIIAELEAMLARLQRNEQAKKEIRRMEKKDPTGHKNVTALLTKLIKDLDKLLKDQTDVADKFERLPSKKPDELKEDQLKALKDLEDLKKRTEKWAKGSVNELTKLPEGFIKDFDMRKDVNKVFEEIEKAAGKSQAQKMDVSLEDLGAGLATRMKEDLEIWLPDAADAVKWVLEEPLDKKNMKIPEMPLPKALEDLVGELLQKADEFDEDADDVTSGWGDNLDQNGWGAADGPISFFSAKGKTGNDQPNNMEATGRSGDGRRGKSTGQMVGDTARGLPGRKTPARVGQEKYEPGQLKNEGSEDPNGATGGGKKAGGGRRGLQGGAPPDITKDIGRLDPKQAGIREKAEQVAQKLETAGVSTTRLKESIDLMKSVEKDLADHRYADAARKRKEAMNKMRSAFSDVDQTTASRINQARDLPPQLRNELLQGAEEGYPAGYEGLLKSYYKALSTAEK